MNCVHDKEIKDLKKDMIILWVVVILCIVFSIIVLSALYLLNKKLDALNTPMDQHINYKGPILMGV